MNAEQGEHAPPKKALTRTHLAFFLIFYFMEGMNSGLFISYLPLFLINKIPGLKEQFFLQLTGLALIPFSIKIIWGVFTDKIGSKKYGFRRPWIAFGIILCGAAWLMVIPVVEQLVGQVESGGDAEFWPLLVIVLLVASGMALGDTALDGMIMDATPSGKLGQVEGFTWAFNGIGVAVGGVVGIALLTLIHNGYIIIVIFGIACILVGVFLWRIKETMLESRFTGKSVVNLFNIRSQVGKRYWNAYFFGIFSSLATGIIQSMVLIWYLLGIGVLKTDPGGLELYSVDPSLIWDVLGITAMQGAGSIMGSAVYGKLGDIRDAKKIYVLAVFHLILTSIAVAFLMINRWLGLVLLFLIGFASGGFIAVKMTFLARLSQSPKESKATNFSMLISMTNLGGAIGLLIWSPILANIRSAMDPAMIYPITFLLAPLLFLTSLPFLKLLPRENNPHLSS
ncbi:MAG: MFS transporter [Candidatus Hodarchaeota archaeon]